MAGMPAEIVESAQRTLDALEKGEVPQVLRSAEKTKAGTVENGAVQLSFFQLDDPTLSAIRDYLKDADLNNMTPMQAFDLLRYKRVQFIVEISMTALSSSLSTRTATRHQLRAAARLGIISTVRTYSPFSFCSN